MDDVISQLAVEIARQIVPDERYQAPLILENFARGGRARKKLLRPDKNGGELGGFGASAALVFPWILHAMTVAAPFLVGFLSSKTVDNAGSIAKEIRAALQARQSKSQKQMPHDQLSEPSVESPVPPQDHFSPHTQSWQQSLGALADTLRKAGVSPEESGNVARTLTLLLWENAPEALLLLSKLMEKK